MAGLSSTRHDSFAGWQRGVLERGRVRPGSLGDQGLEVDMRAATEPVSGDLVQLDEGSHDRHDLTTRPAYSRAGGDRPLAEQDTDLGS